MKIGLLGAILATLPLVTMSDLSCKAVSLSDNEEIQQVEWDFVSGDHLEVYYFGDGRSEAEEVFKYLAPEVERISNVFGYQVYPKIGMVLYPSERDLHKVDINEKISKPFLKVVHIGTEEQFREALLKQTASLIANNMMFGNNLKKLFSRSQMKLPDWIANGAAAYAASSWTSELDGYVHQIIAAEKEDRIESLTGKDAEIMGQSIWNFIAEKYGPSTVASILNYTRVTRNEEESVLQVTDIHFEQLLVEWKKFYSYGG